VKKNDAEAAKQEVVKRDRSVVSGRTVEAVSEADDLGLDDFPEADMPRRIRPMLATLIKEPFDNPDWLYEIKWDGYRAIASWDGEKAELYSRAGNDFSQKYPEVTEAVRGMSQRVVLDGEIVAVDSEGRSHFEWLQNWSREPRGQLIYYVFDLLWCDGHDLRGQPLTERKSLLQKILSSGSVIRYSDHIEGNGTAFFKTAEEQRIEGIMAKDEASRYLEGRRSKQWLKIKTHQRQEAVIGGFTEPRGSRKHIGALVLGVYKNNQLIYVGHTGGGIPTQQMPTLRKKLEGLERKTSPFVTKFKPNAPVHWASPKLVCEVSFAEPTAICANLFL
jgi:bifunctional non-homologous end joining protein LigD